VRCGWRWLSLGERGPVLSSACGCAWIACGGHKWKAGNCAPQVSCALRVTRRQAIFGGMSGEVVKSGKRIVDFWSLFPAKPGGVQRRGKLFSGGFGTEGEHWRRATFGLDGGARGARSERGKTKEDQEERAWRDTGYAVSLPGGHNYCRDPWPSRSHGPKMILLIGVPASFR